MKMIWFSAVALGMLIPLLAQGEIPLHMKTTIILPGTGPWDVGHWMDQRSYGWAQTWGTTIWYKTNEEDSVHEFVIPTEVFEQYGFSMPPFARNTRLLVVGDTLHRLSLVWQGDGRRWESGGPEDFEDVHVLCLLDLSTENLICQFSTIGSYRYTAAGAVRSAQSTMVYFAPWSPPPLVASSILLARQVQTYFSAPGGNESESYYGGIYYINLGATPPSSTVIDGGSKVGPFADTITARFAIQGNAWARDYHNGQLVNSWSRAWITTFRPGSGVAPHDTLHDNCVAQQDTDGSQRLIVQAWHGMAALDANTYAELWRDSTIRGYGFTARLSPYESERILIPSTGVQTFRVCDASNAALLDSTSAYEGDFRMFLKRPGYSDEIVTWD